MDELKIETNGSPQGTIIYINGIEFTEKFAVQYLKLYSEIGEDPIKVEIGVYDEFDLLSTFEFINNYIELKSLIKPF